MPYDEKDKRKWGSMADVQAFLVSPKDNDTYRILECLVCGAVTYISLPGQESGMGNPVRHDQYHKSRGEGPGTTN